MVGKGNRTILDTTVQWTVVRDDLTERIRTLRIALNQIDFLGSTIPDHHLMKVKWWFFFYRTASVQHEP